MGKRSRLRKRKNRETARKFAELLRCPNGIFNATTLPMSEWRALDIPPLSMRYVESRVVAERLVYSRGAIRTVQEVSHEFSYRHP